MMNDFGLPESVISDVLSVLRRYPEINCAKIFGSRVKGNYKRYSDVDIAIFADSDRELSQSIRDSLEDLDTIYRFDVVDYDRLSNTEIKAHIDRVGVEFYSARE